jgi:hypothetical protein
MPRILRDLKVHCRIHKNTQPQRASVCCDSILRMFEVGSHVCEHRTVNVRYKQVGKQSAFCEILCSYRRGAGDLSLMGC